MRLVDLTLHVPGARVVSSPEAHVRRVIYDSRQARPGDLFVAIPGEHHDGAEFAADAVARGATGVAAERRLRLPDGVGLLLVSNARRALGDLSSALYSHPSQRLRLVGVTGTDGKTTTSQLIGYILAATGRRIGWMTSVTVRFGNHAEPTPFSHTTPEASEIQEMLQRFADGGVEDAVIEVSSHALALDRVRGCQFDAAVFTNLAPEHLNYHRTMEDYAGAKARLFEMLDEQTAKPWPRIAVVNADDPVSQAMVAATGQSVVTFGLGHPADVTARRVKLDRSGSTFRLATPLGDCDIVTRLPGRHNVMNWLAAAAVAVGWDIPPEVVAKAARTASLPRGRLQPVQQGQPFQVLVDFAHTPQAMAATLATVRVATEGKVYVVFGMAGGRYAANRPRMGEVVARNADFFVVTADDPYPEDPADIAGQIISGARAAGAGEGRDFVVQLNRRVAFRIALERARPGDTVLLAGKGHERHMMLAEVIPWNEEDVASAVLAELGYPGVGS